MASRQITGLSGRSASMPTSISPMLCSLIKEPFDDPEFLFEVKWDGYRLISYKQGQSIKLLSRGGHDYTKKYPPIATALKSVRDDFIVDGEAIVLNSQGKPDFDALQKFNGQQSGVVYYVFDLLWLNGKNLMHFPLVERKIKLKTLCEGSEVIKYCEDFDNGTALFRQIESVGLEGIVAKRRHSKYTPGKRGSDWLKIPTENRQEFVIGGWVESEKRNTFRTLLFGAYENGKLKWKGHAGGGFKEQEMPVILNRLKAIETDANPFDSEVEYSEGRPHWVKPELVANIKFATTTKSGKIRKPAIFLGFRGDKRPEQVITEHARQPRKNRPREDNSETKNPTRRISKKDIPTTDSNWPLLESQPIRNQEVFQVDDCSIVLHNVDKQLWKMVTKADLITYYNSVSKYILPHLQDRPLSLHVKLNGPNAPGLYIKDMEQRQPSCAQIFSTDRKHKKSGKREVIDYLVCNNTATLLYMIDLGCIDVNPWTSKVSSPTRPDFIVLDLDPSDENFANAIEAAKAVKEVLYRRKLVAFPKTSGKTGIHVFIPCTGLSFTDSRKVAEVLCREVNLMLPNLTTMTVAVADRGGKLYLDPNQNDYSDTVACAYSVRPYKLPLVSTPLEWKEIKLDLDPHAFTPKTTLARLEKKGDIFYSVLDRTVAHTNMPAIKRLL